MNKKIKEILFCIISATLPVVAFSGAITSSLAWYSYKSKVGVSYSGTAISISNLLQVGIVTDLDLSEYGLTTTDGIAWADIGKTLTPAAVGKYLSEMDYAYSMFTPITSGGYKDGEDLSLQQSPMYQQGKSDKAADTSSYAKIPLAFKTFTTSGLLLDNEKVWLNEVSILSNDSANIGNGIRLFFDDGEEKFIVSPERTEAGKTIVAGLQDLNDDGWYDYEDGKEIVYGYYDGTPNYEHSTAPSELEDVNETGHEERSTFYAKHEADIDVIHSYTGLDLDYAEYEVVETVKPTKNLDGELVDGRPVCVTNDDGIAFTDITIWVEGWDHVVNNSMHGYKFLLNLVFIINAN